MKIFKNPQIVAMEEIYKMLCRGRKRMRIISDSESDIEANIPGTSQNASGKEIADGGTMWQKVEIDLVADHLSIHNSKTLQDQPAI